MNTQTLFILPLPETTNHIYRSGKNGWYKSAKQVAWETQAGYVVKKTWKNKKLLEGNIALKVTFYVSRDRDIDGSLKPILDILQRMNVYRNDRQVVKLDVRKKTDKAYPRVTVLLSELKGEK